MKPYINMNSQKSKKAKNESEKDFKLMINSVLGKTMDNVRNHRDIKLVTTNRKRKQLVSEPNYLVGNRNVVGIRMKKTKLRMNQPIYLDMSKLSISKTLMCQSWYDYIKPKYGDRIKLCYTDTDCFIIHIITKDISDNVERWFDTSNYNENDKKPVPIGKNKKVKIMEERLWKNFVDVEQKHGHT